MLKELTTRRSSSSRRLSRPDHLSPSRLRQDGCASTRRIFGSMGIQRTAQDVFHFAMEPLCEPGVTTQTHAGPGWRASSVAIALNGLRPDVNVSSTSDCSKKTLESTKMLQKLRRVHQQRRHRDPAQILVQLRTGRFDSRRRAGLMSGRAHRPVDPQINPRPQTDASLRVARPRLTTRGVQTQRGREAYRQARHRLTTRRG